MEELSIFNQSDAHACLTVPPSKPETYVSCTEDAVEVHSPSRLPVECPTFFQKFPIEVVAEYTHECAALLLNLILEGKINDISIEPNVPV